MSAVVAFAPKAEFSDPDCLGSIFVNDTSDLNVREAVAEGKGYILTTDPDTINALDTYHALKRVSVTEAREALSSKKKPSGGSGGDDGGKS